MSERGFTEADVRRTMCTCITHNPHRLNSTHPLAVKENVSSESETRADSQIHAHQVSYTEVALGVRVYVQRGLLISHIQRPTYV